MKDFDEVLIDLQVIMDDIQCRAELKRQKELEVEKLNSDIEQLKGKALDLIQRNLELKVKRNEIIGSLSIEGEVDIEKITGTLNQKLRE